MAPENRIHHRKSSGRTSRSDRKENRRRRLAALFLACVILAAGGIPVAGGTVSAGETGAVAVSAGADIGSNSRTVRAGIFHFDGYHMKDEDGNLSGYGIEFLNMAAEYSHLNFQYVEYDKSWNDMLTMLEAGDIDVVTSGRKTEEWEEKYAFSLPIGRNSTILSIQADNDRLHSGDYDTYEGMVIGAVEGRSQKQSLEEFAQEHGFSYRIVEYGGADELTAALQAGEVDAILSTSLRKTENERTLDVIETDYFYAIVRKEDTELLHEINYAIGQMDINEGDWMNVLAYRYYGPVYSDSTLFTEREKAYIQDVIAGRKTITAIAIGDREPYSYVEDGEMKGIMPDYFAAVMDMAGLPYELVVTPDRASYFELADSGSVDVIIDKKDFEPVTEGMASRGFGTDTYLTAGVAKVTRKDFDGEITAVAIAETQDNAPIEQGLTGDAELLYYPTREAALQAVMDGEAEAAFVYTYTAQLFVNNDFTDSLHYAIMNDVSFSFRMYVREGCDRELLTILNKCIDQMPDEVMNQLVTTYTVYTPQDLRFADFLRIHPEAMMGVGLTVVLALGVILALVIRTRWNKKILETTEEANRELLEQLAIVDALSRDFVNVFAVDVGRNRARIIKMMGYVTTGLHGDVKEEFTYDVIVDRYIRERVYEEDQAGLKEALALENVLRKLETGRDYQGNYRVKDGDEVHNYQFSYVHVKKSDFRKEGFILAGFRNIDETIREEQVQKLMLAEALGEAQYANNAKTTFLNSMSHDIRTPMNAIIGFTSLALSHIDNRELVKNYLEKIITSGNHLLSLINDVLDMSRIESGKVKIEEKEASLPEIIHDLKTIVQSDVKAKQLSFSIDAQDVTDEFIICDRLRLNQVLLNLLSNAMKYTKPGGAVSVRIIQTGDAPEGCAAFEFRVKDTGVGMSREFMEHLFEPFEREQTATISGIQGTGLGLSITKNIVDMMHGTIVVESEPGKGSEFIVSFRFRVAGKPLKTEHLSQLAGKRALVVDDDINTCTSVSRMLSAMGLHPDWTTLGKEAVVRSRFALEQEEPFDLYLVDWMMPDMNGVETVRRIRRIVGEEAPIIILTAYDWGDIEEEAREAGVTTFCSKPVFLSELCNVLTAPYGTGEQKEQEEALPPCFEGKKILLVEDNEINQEIARTILEEAGFVVDTAEDGTVAVEKMKENPAGTYDLILMDVQMPIMNGYQATRAIRALEDSARAAIPIVAMTANAFDEDRMLALEAGMDGHIAKPIDIAMLMETLREILKG
nr:response regulator [uncultured Acetatifactor sp.]